MSLTRSPAVAGMFYPADASTLVHDIQHYLNAADEQPIVPKAIVVPHAGYIYSGPVAASAYKLLLPLRDQINTVVLLGPSHRVAFSGLAAPESDVFNTPLGDIKINQQAIASISDLPQVLLSDRAHRDEHSLEVQLPFLQQVLDDFTLVPLVVGDAERHDVAEVINRLWGDEHTLIVISTDLSHYHEYNEARRMDRLTSDAIEHLKPDIIGYEDACGRNGLKGMMTVAEQKHMQAITLDLRNSGDTAGSKDQVVGYGAYVFN